MNKHILLQNFIKANPGEIGKVVDVDTSVDKLFQFDFSSSNAELSADAAADTDKFSDWVNKKLSEHNARYGIGGYLEHRTLYARSELFNSDEEPRRLHLGMDIWGPEGTPVYTPLDGYIHSFQDNNNFGDYGPTIILKHNLDSLELFSLYGHLDRKSLEVLIPGHFVTKGMQLGTFGNQKENGHWPPHLHFQLMFDLEGYSGDYPGVGRYSEKQKHQSNIPDPNLILRFPQSCVIG